MSTPIEAAPEPADAQESRGAFPPAFRRLMANSLVAGVTSTFLWFALTFWVYLETRSVVATGVIGGTFSLVAAIVGPLIGTYVDHHRKHTSLVLTSAMAAVSFAVAHGRLLLGRRRRPPATRRPVVLAAGRVDADGFRRRQRPCRRAGHLRDDPRPGATP